jgi:hypothetical protein
MIAEVLFASWIRRSQMRSAFINAREGGDAVALGLKNISLARVAGMLMVIVGVVLLTLAR